jgi:ABC-type multidrug transport system fused ATPase/permease subunit
MLLALIYNGLEFLAPYLTGRLTDVFAISGKAGIETFLFIASIIIINIFDIILMRLRQRRSNWLSIRMQTDFITDITNHLKNLPMNYHNSKKIGSVLNRIGNASNHFFGLIDDILFSSLPSLVTLIAVIILILFMNPTLAILLLFQVIMFTVVTINKTRGITIWSKKVDIKSDKAWGHLWDYIVNVALVKSSGNEEYENKKSRELFSNVEKTYEIHSSMWRNLASWQRFVMRYGYLVVLCTALYMVKVSHRITFGEFVMFIGYANMAYTPMAQLAVQYRSLRRGLASTERAYRLKSQKTEFETWTGKTKLNQIKGRIEFKNVVFGYNGEDIVLDGVSFTVEPGQVIAFVGKSGVGKTSLIDLISGYYPIRSGQILIDNVDIRQIDLKSLRDALAYVPQESVLFNDTLGFNIEYANLTANKETFKKAVESSAVNEFVDPLPFGFGTLVGERGIKLSGGQRQRIAIARAILRNKPIILLDEATSALDSVSEKLIQNSLKDLVKGRTTFVIAHRLSTILHADKIIVLDKGKVVETGNHNELMLIPNGHYRKFFMIQSGTLDLREEVN